MAQQRANPRELDGCVVHGPSIVAGDSGLNGAHAVEGREARRDGDAAKAWPDGQDAEAESTGVMEELAGKTAVVTGAASGIGLALARRLADEGMTLVLADVERAALDAAVADPDAADVLRDAAVDRFGTVHVVCNNAGVGGFGDTTWGDELSKAMYELTHAMVDAGLPPEQMADALLDALRTDRFFVTTHPADAAALAAQRADIVDGAEPTLPQLG